MGRHRAAGYAGQDAYHDTYDAVEVEARALTDYLKDLVDPGWRNSGGASGSIYEWAGQLIVRHTPEGHRQIEDYLKQLSIEFAKD